MARFGGPFLVQKLLKVAAIRNCFALIKIEAEHGAEWQRSPRFWGKVVGIGGPYGGSYALGVPVGGLEIDVEFTVVGVAEGYGPVSIDPAALAGRFVGQHILGGEVHAAELFFLDNFDGGGGVRE